MQIPTGIVADRVNLRWLYAGAFVLWSVAQGLMGFATGLGMLIAFRILLGIGEAIYLPGGSKIVSLMFRPSERGLPCGLFDFGTRTGLVIEGVLLPWVLLTPQKLQADRTVNPRASKVDVPAKIKMLLTNRNLLGICLGFFCFDYYWYFLVNWLPDYLVTSRGLTILKAGFYAALPDLVFGISEPVGGWIADRLGSAGWR